MKRLETKYRVFKVSNAAGDDDKHHGLVFEYCTHIEFEIEDDAKDWILEHGDYRTSTHDYIVMPCIRIIKEQE